MSSFVESLPYHLLYDGLYLWPSCIVLALSSVYNVRMRRVPSARFVRFDEAAVLLWALSANLQRSSLANQCCFEPICVTYWFVDLLPLLWGLGLLFSLLFAVRIYCGADRPFSVSFALCVALATTFLELFFLGYLWAIDLSAIG